MNRKLLAKLLQKNIEELFMMTESFSESTNFSPAIITLARRKTEDIQTIIDELALSQEAKTMHTAPVSSETLVTIPHKTQQETLDSSNFENKISAPILLLETSDNQKIDKSETEKDTVAVEENEEQNSLEENIRMEFLEIEKIEDVEEEVEEEADKEVEVNENEEYKEEEEVKESIFQNIVVENIVVEEKTAFEENQTLVIDLVKKEDNPTPQIDEKLIDMLVRNALENSDVVEKSTENGIPNTTRKTIADKVASGTHSRNEMLSHADNSLSASLANKKISDIKQAISIGDRFRFQRELFKSNGEDMNKTLTYINQLATFEEVLAFVNSKYAWDEKNPAVIDFYQLVKRKF